MDFYTELHLDRWLAGEVRHTDARRAIKAAMVVEFETDPEFYGTHTWQRTYDAIGGLAIEQVFAGEPELAEEDR